MTMADLLASLPQVGQVTGLCVRPGRDQPAEPRDRVMAIADRGLEGDRFAGRPGAKRQVTLIQQEHLAAIAGMLALDGPIDPLLTRRNLVVSGLNLLALKGRRFQVGGAVLAYTGPCDPCSHMEATFGPGAWNAMRGHGGICARILEGGPIALGDSVRVTMGDAEGDPPSPASDGSDEAD